MHQRAEHRIVHGLDLEAIDRFLAGLASACQAVDVRFQWRPQLSDPKVELVLETAINRQADVLVIHNVSDFALAARKFGLRVRRPGQLLKEMRL